MARGPAYDLLRVVGVLNGVSFREEVASSDVHLFLFVASSTHPILHRELGTSWSSPAV